jgi:hypothetical protein
VKLSVKIDATRRCASPSAAAGGCAARESERHAVPLILEIVADEHDHGRRALCGDRLHQPSRPRAQRVGSWRGRRACRRRWRVAHHQGLALEIQAGDLGDVRDHDRRVHVREHRGVGDDVAAHAERRAADRHRTARRHAEALEREELEVGAVVAGWLESRGARAFGEPR